MGAKQSTERWIAGSAAVTGRTQLPATPLPESFVKAFKENEELWKQFQLPGTDEYLKNNTCWNFDAIESPSAIFVPRHVEDLKQFIQLYTKNLPGHPHTLSISGGRHSHYGMKKDSVVVDMTKFDSINIDVEGRKGRFGSGLRLNEYDLACKEKGLAGVAGTNPDTGIAGLTLGGGFGMLCRRHGFAADNLLSIRGVLASGEEVYATRDNEHSDLLWGCKGGGGNFCIVTEFEFNLFPRGDVYWGSSVYLTRMFTNVQQLIRDWRDYNNNAPNDIACLMVMPCGGPVVTNTCYIGDDPENGEKAVATVRKLHNPLIQSYARTPYCGGTKIGHDIQSSAMDHQTPGNWYESGVVLREMSNEVIDILLKYSAAPHIPNKTSAFVLARLGGVTTIPSPDDAPIGWRNGWAVVMILGKWDNQSTKEAYTKARNDTVKWIKEVIKELGPYCKAGYNTLGDVALDKVKAAALKGGEEKSALAAESKSPEGEFASIAPATPISPPICDPVSANKENDQVTSPLDLKAVTGHSELQFKRLRACKDKYDPNNIFRNNNNIRPTPVAAPH